MRLDLACDNFFLLLSDGGRQRSVATLAQPGQSWVSHCAEPQNLRPSSLILPHHHLIHATQALSERSGVILVDYYHQAYADWGKAARRRMGHSSYHAAFEAGRLIRKGEAPELAEKLI